jgi:hypothetical protein
MAAGCGTSVNVFDAMAGMSSSCVTPSAPATKEATERVPASFDGRAAAKTHKLMRVVLRAKQ